MHDVCIYQGWCKYGYSFAVVVSSEERETSGCWWTKEEQCHLVSCLGVFSVAGMPIGMLWDLTSLFELSPPEYTEADDWWDHAHQGTGWSFEGGRWIRKSKNTKRG
jgi:hypothetical protein